MKRRTFIAGLGSMAAWPVAARAQQSAMPVIGWLSSQSAADDVRNVTAAFFRGLKETGYVESQNVMVDYRNADNQMDRLPALAADLVRRRVAVIVAGGNDASVAGVRFKVMRRFVNRQRVGKWQRRHSASGCYWQFLRRPLKFACRFASTVITVASSEGNLKEAAMIETSRVAKVRSVSASLWIAPPFTRLSTTYGRAVRS